MPRLKEVGRADAGSELILRYYDALFGDRDPVTQPGTATGTRGNWWTVFAGSLDIFKHAVEGFALYSSPARRLDPVLRELAQTRAGWCKASQFVFSQHCKSLRGLGVAEDKIAAVSAWQVSPLFDDRERAVLAYADCLCLNAGRTPEPVVEALKGFLGDEEILELTYITCLYEMHAVMTKALRLEFDDRDDPIVEVPAPESFDAADFLGGARRGGGEAR